VWPVLRLSLGPRRGEATENGRYVDFYEAAARVKRDRCVRCSSCSLRSDQRSTASDPDPREVGSSFYSRSSGASGARRRMRGVERWGRHLGNGARTAAKSTHAFTHPSNLRGKSVIIAPRTASDCHSAMFAFAPRRSSDGSDRLRRVARHASWRVRRPVAQHRIEEAGQAAGQRDDGNLLAAARGDARGPTPQGGVRGSRRRRIDTAAWTSNQRIRVFPALVIRPRRWLSPELTSRGTRPRYASTSCAR